MGAKYTEAQARAFDAYEARTFKKILFRFRLDQDADIIEDYNKALESGMKKNEWFREIYEKKFLNLTTDKVRRSMERCGVDQQTISRVMDELTKEAG